MPTDKYLLAFQACYSRCSAALSKSHLAHNYKFELYPYLYALFAYMLRVHNSLPRETINPIIVWIMSSLPDKQHSTFWYRTNFYIDVVSDKVEIRAEWSVSEPIDFSTPFLRMYFAFGDILVNSSCGNDYKSAPILLNSILNCRSLSILWHMS